MSIALVVTRGFGNGTLLGDVNDTVTRGYSIGAIQVPDTPGIEYSMIGEPHHFTMPDRKIHYDIDTR